MQLYEHKLCGMVSTLVTDYFSIQQKTFELRTYFEIFFLGKRTTGCIKHKVVHLHFIFIKITLTIKSTSYLVVCKVWALSGPTWEGGKE